MLSRSTWSAVSLALSWLALGFLGSVRLFPAAYKLMFTNYVCTKRGGESLANFE